MTHDARGARCEVRGARCEVPKCEVRSAVRLTLRTRCTRSRKSVGQLEAPLQRLPDVVRRIPIAAQEYFHGWRAGELGGEADRPTAIGGDNGGDLHRHAVV